MNNSQDSHFRPRCHISGKIEVKTALHIGSGETVFRPLEENQKVQISMVLSDYRGKPYIPGSSLRGWLRDTLREKGMESGRLHTLFGTDAKGKERGGKLLVANSYLDLRTSTEPELSHALSLASRDCQDIPFSPAPEDRCHERRWWDKNRWTWIVNGVSLNRFTRAATEHLLFHYEVVPPGAVFDLAIDGIGLTDEELGWILAVLEDAGEPAHMVLGQGQALGYGQCLITGKLTVACLHTYEQMRVWLDQDKSIWFKKIPPIDVAALAALGSTAQLADTTSICSLHIKLYFDGPLLVNDPSSCYKSNKNKNADNSLSHVYLGDHNNQIVLPGRSFKGAFRSQIEKIARTMLDCKFDTPLQPDQLQKIACYPHDDNVSCPDVKKIIDLENCCLVCRLCGAKGYRSPLMVSDFTVAEEGCLRQQEFVAIDRFTGGAAPQKKFNALHREKPVLQGAISLDLARLDSTLIGLFALALRDLLEGDIRFGFGRSRGYGSCTAKIIRISGPAKWPAAMEQKNQKDGPVREFLKSCAKHHQPFTDDNCLINAAILIETLEQHVEKIAKGE